MVSTGAVALLAATTVYLLMIIGGYVRASGFGLACPDWPTCNGQIIPEFTPPVIAEYAHRLSAALASLLVLITMILAIKRHRNSKIALFAMLSFFLIVVQVLMGMLAVLSGLNPLIGTAHLALATAVFGSSVVTAVLARKVSAHL